MTIPIELCKLLFKLVNNYDNVRSQREALYNEKLQCLQIVNNSVGQVTQVCKETDNLKIFLNINKIITLERKELLTEQRYLEEISGVTDICNMIRRPLTEITLKLDDLQEYETMRRDQGSSNSSSAEMQEDPTKPLSAGPKTQEEIHNRIGYAPKKKSRGVSTV